MQNCEILLLSNYKLLSSRLPFKKVRSNKYRAMILLAVLQVISLLQYEENTNRSSRKRCSGKYLDLGVKK